jgi:hypothetical protein
VLLAKHPRPLAEKRASPMRSGRSIAYPYLTCRHPGPASQESGSIGGFPHKRGRQSSGHAPFPALGILRVEGTAPLPAKGRAIFPSPSMGEGRLPVPFAAAAIDDCARIPRGRSRSRGTGLSGVGISQARTSRAGDQSRCSGANSVLSPRRQASTRNGVSGSSPRLTTASRLTLAPPVVRASAWIV